MPNPFWVNIAQQLSVLGEWKLVLIAAIIATVIYGAALIREITS